VRVAAILLAAGEGRRVGGPKGLLTLGGESFLARCARLLDRPAIAEILAVLGCEAERLRALPDVPKRVRFVVHPRYADGMLSSLLRGLDEAEARGADAVLVHPVDHPIVSVPTIDAVLKILGERRPIVVPSVAGRRGHPAGFARRTWEALRAADAQRGARDVLLRHPEWVTHVDGDPGCATGVNTPRDYEAVTRLFAASEGAAGRGC
jgi:CTP:molybdopterin cytidylyltransferase MocA